MNDWGFIDENIEEEDIQLMLFIKKDSFSPYLCNAYFFIEMSKSRGGTHHA